MPSPLAHALAGFITHVATAPAGEIANRRRALVTVGAAMAPDLDFGWRLVDGMNHHQEQGHSVGVGLAVAALVAAVASAARVPRPIGLGAAALLGWCSHLFLDFLSIDNSPPIGLLALWPLSTGHFKSPWPLFLDIGRTLNWRTVRHDAIAIAWELAVLCPLLIAAWRTRNRRRFGAWNGARLREQVGR